MDGEAGHKVTLVTEPSSFAVEQLKGTYELRGALLSLSGAAVGAAATIVVALVTQAVTFRVHRRTLFVETVTQERATWRSELRVATSKLLGLVEGALDGQDVSRRDLVEARVAVRLRLNPNAGVDNPVDRNADDALKALRVSTFKEPSSWNQAKVRRTMLGVEVCIQAVLKQEWGVSKEEARTGRLSGERKLKYAEMFASPLRGTGPPAHAQMQEPQSHES